MENPRLQNHPAVLNLLRAPLRWLRRLYDWMLGFANHPQAEPALFGLSFAEASFFPLPPDPLLLVMGAAKPHRALRFAAVTTLGSVLGALAGWMIGSFFMETIGVTLLDLYDSDRHIWGKIENWYAEYGNVALLLAALTPIPFKVFTIASGALAYPLAPFLAASLLGRGLRFGAEGLLLRFFGQRIVGWMEKWFDLLAILFMVLLVGGFVALKWLK